MDWLTLTGLTIAVLGAGATGGMFPPGPWYDALDKPPWTPPNWLFPLAWSILYILIIAAGYRLLQMPPEVSAAPMAFWAAQLSLNAIWTPVFFGLRRMGVALGVVGLLWLVVLTLLVLSLQADLLTGLMFVPYLAWVTVAAALNAEVLRRNPKARDMAA